jgi:hypothetical protein
VNRSVHTSSHIQSKVQSQTGAFKYRQRTFSLRIQVIWDMTLCHWAGNFWHFKGTQCLNLQRSRIATWFTGGCQSVSSSFRAPTHNQAPPTPTQLACQCSLAWFLWHGVHTSWNKFYWQLNMTTTATDIQKNSESAQMRNR